MRFGKRILRSTRRAALRGAPVILAAAALSLSAGCKKGVIVRGKVVDASSDEPLSGARVSVVFRRLDSNMNWLDGGHADLITNPDGTFKTQNPDMRARFIVTARMKGYYPNHDCRPMNTMERSPAAFTHNVVVTLYPVRAPRPLPRGSDAEARWFRSGRRLGWSLAQGRMVDAAQADFFVEPDEVGNAITYLTANGQGGFVHADWLSGDYALYNMPEAPNARYAQRFDLRAVGNDERPVFFVRSADGFHYGKIDVTGTTKSREYLGLRFTWVYQPDGSRALEIPFSENSLSPVPPEKKD